MLTLSALASAGALAQDPPPSSTTVEPEPPGANCPSGGVKITITPIEPTPTPSPTATPTPTPEPTATPTPRARAAQAEPDVYFVCDGQQGDPGSDGLDGSDGRDGSDGDDGDSAEESDEPSTATRRRCQPSRRVVSWRLPERFRGQRVRLRVDGQRRFPRLQGRAVRVDFRGLRCGVYPILAQAPGVRSALRIYRVQGAYRLTRVPIG